MTTPQTMPALDYFLAQNLLIADLSKLSSTTSGLLLRSEPTALEYRSLIQWSLSDGSSKRARFATDALAKSPYPWAGNIFSDYGITDNSVTWQIRRRAELAKHSFPEAQYIRPTMRIACSSDEQYVLQVSDKEARGAETENLILSEIVKALRTEEFRLSNTAVFVEMQAASTASPLLGLLGRAAFVLPIDIIVVSESRKTLDKILSPETPGIPNLILAFKNLNYYVPINAEGHVTSPNSRQSRMHLDNEGALIEFAAQQKCHALTKICQTETIANSVSKRFDQEITPR